jgi:hypothetical protein
MLTGDLTSWREELLHTGAIVQDADHTVPQDERDRRFKRYVELVDAITGEEGVAVARALIRSYQVKDDYGAYGHTYHALGRFPTPLFVEALLRELPDLIRRQPDWAGDILCGLANSVGTRWAKDIIEFRSQLQQASPTEQAAIREYIGGEEQDGWLKHRRGVLSE